MRNAAVRRGTVGRLRVGLLLAVEALMVLEEEDGRGWGRGILIFPNFCFGFLLPIISV